MLETITSRQRVIKMLEGEKITPVPCFSGVGNVTSVGMDKLGYRFAEIHNDARKMAETAITTWELFGYECVVIPLDLCLEAEAMGCEMNPYGDAKELLYPTIKEKSRPTTKQIRAMATPDILKKGRIPLLIEAARIVREKIGDQAPIGSYVLGPFTLGGQVGDLEPLLKNAFKKPEETMEYLNALADIIILVGTELMKGEVDYISVREMGATTDILSPRVFRNLIVPPLRKIAAVLPNPNILHICGSVLPIIEDMYGCGFDAISIDSKTSMKEARAKLGPNAVICGNFNPFATLNTGGEKEAYETVAQCVKDGASAVHPGCDIWPTAKPENMEAMIRACKETAVNATAE